MSVFVRKIFENVRGIGFGLAAGALALTAITSSANAVVYTIAADQLDHQNCGVFPAGCYRGSMSFDFDTVGGTFSNISWNLGYNTSSGNIMESVVTSGQDTKVASSVGVPYTTARVVALTGTFFTPDWLFYSDIAPTVTNPGPNYLFEYSGAGLLIDALGLDIDLNDVIANGASDMTVVYMVPNGGSSNAYGGRVTATLLTNPDPDPEPLPAPATALLVLTGFGAMAAVRRRKQ